ncbi:MAG: M14 family zinc carboxypeptidase, partial [Armatimonadota bacterium]
MKHPVIRIAVLLSILVLFSANVSAATLTSHKKMMAQLALLSKKDANAGRVSVVNIGTSVKGRDIPLVIITDPAVPEESKKRLFIICRQHGDEPATTEAMLRLISRLAVLEDQDVADILSKVSFYFVPMVNPDGADAFRRKNANGADLNRDWINLSQPETRCVWAAIDAAAPDVLLDMHELSPGNRTGDFIESAGA